MTIFKVGDIVTPKNKAELEMVEAQSRSQRRRLPDPLHFKVKEMSRLDYSGELILYYEGGYHSYAHRMKLITPPDRNLDDYL